MDMLCVAAPLALIPIDRIRGESVDKFPKFAVRLNSSLKPSVAPSASLLEPTAPSKTND
jgi:hypothetical protein